MEPPQVQFYAIHLLVESVVHLLILLEREVKLDPASHFVASNSCPFLTVRSSEILNVGKLGRFLALSRFSLGNAEN